VSFSAVGVFAGAAAAGAVAFQLLGYLHLRTLVTVLAALIVAVLGWLAQRSRVASSRAQTWNARAAAIEEALAVWPLRRVGVAGSSLFDTGVFPVARPAPSFASTRRELGGDVDGWLREGEIILLVGPAGCGKSSLALALLRELLPDAWLLAPDGAHGLDALLALDPPFALIEGESAVVLLDGLDRFIAGLQVGQLDEVRSHIEHLHVIATIRDDELASLLRSSNQDGHVMRRFLARARVVPVAGGAEEDSPEHWRLGQAPLIAPPTGPGPRTQTEDPVSPPAPPSVLRDWGVRGLTTLTILILLALGGIELAEGVVNPPPVAAQVTALRNQPDACGSRSVYAPPADAISWDQPVVVVTRGVVQCNAGSESDQVSVFVPVAGKLAQIYAFQPAQAHGSVYTFSCLGTLSSDPCLTDLGGTSAYAVTGAFTNTSTERTYPVAIQQAAGGFRIFPLQLPAGRKGARPATSKLIDGFAAVTVRPTTAFAIVQPFANQLPVYVTGAVSRGTFDAPSALRASGWSPTMRAGTMFFDRRCKPPAPRDTMRVSFAGASGNFAQDLGRELGRYWTKLTRPEGEACP
jgi:DNA polymerase III delta prime subunit